MPYAEFAYVAIAIGTALCGIAAWIYKRGKNDGIEQADAESISKKIDDVKTTLKSEIENTDESHRIIHQRIDSLFTTINQHHKCLEGKINDVNITVADLAGQFKNHIRESKH